MFDYLKNVTLKVFLVTIFAAVCTYYIMFIEIGGFFVFLCVFLLSSFVTMIISYLIGLTSGEKRIVHEQFGKVLQLKNNNSVNNKKRLSSNNNTIKEKEISIVVFWIQI